MSIFPKGEMNNIYMYMYVATINLQIILTNAWMVIELCMHVYWYDKEATNMRKNTHFKYIIIPEYLLLL